MLDILKNELYFRKMHLLYKKGIEDGSIVPFDEDFYKKMSHTYISCLPVSIHIKYLKPIMGPGKCYDRSLYMFFCFKNAVLVRGDTKDLELKYGKESAGHGWIEIGDYCYDPSLLCKFKRDVYYRMYKPYNISKTTLEEYINYNKGCCKQFYENIVNTKLEDFLPNGSKRLDLCMTIPLVQGIAENGKDENFKTELKDYLELIQYDERQLFEELDNSFRTKALTSR